MCLVQKTQLDWTPCVWAFQATHVALVLVSIVRIGPQPCGLFRRSRRLGNTAQVLVKISRRRLHLLQRRCCAAPLWYWRPPLGRLSPSAPSNSIAASPEMMGAASSMSIRVDVLPELENRDSASCCHWAEPKTCRRTLTNTPCYKTSSGEQQTRQHPAESSHAQCSTCDW